MASTPDGKTVVVRTSAGITPVDVAANKPGTRVEVAGADAFALLPDGAKAYVVDSNLVGGLGP